MDKVSLRAKLKNERNALSKKYILNKSILLSERVAKIVKKGGVVASYMPFKNEINPNLFIDNAYFPKIKNGNMYMCLGNNGFGRGYGGIKEPFAKCKKTMKKGIDTVIVPGIAFDKRGYRIGYGRGFYDRFLKNFRGLKIGVTFECCIVDKIDAEEHDVAMDFVVSEKRNIVCKLRR